MQHHIVSANEWVYPDTEIPAQPAARADLHVARGARAAFQLLLRPATKGGHVRVEYDGEPAPEVFQLVDVHVPENSGPPCSAIPPDQPTPEYVVRNAPYRVYEALRPLAGDDVARGETEALYVSFMIPTDASPGPSEGTLVVTVGDDEARVPVKVTIYDAVVPEAGALRVTNWFNTGRMAKHHGLEPWSEPHWKMLRHYARLMRRARQTDFIPVGPERARTDDGHWSFDFTRTERMIRLFLDEGFTHIECGHIASHDRRRDAVARFVVNVDGEPKPGTSHEAYEYLAEYLIAWREFLQKNGWYGRAIQHITDEPPPDEFDAYRIIAGTARKFLPGVPIIDALGDPALDGSVDIWVPISDGYEKHREAFEAHRRRGDTLWYYTCCGPSGFHLNRFIDTELLRTRLLHWANWRYRLTGYLHWGLNQIIDEQDPFEDTCPPHGPYRDFHLPPGDSHIVYPGDDGPWSSVRFEAMGSGIEDYELLRQIGERDEALADELCTSLVRTFTDYDAKVDTFDAVHRRLLEEASAA